MTMACYRYDRTFDGFLSAVFEAYRRGETQPDFGIEGVEPASLFGPMISVSTSAERAARVAEGIRWHGLEETLERVYHAFLSDMPGIEGCLWRYLQRLFADGLEAANDPLDGATEAVYRAARRTGREVHRMHAFVRFAEGTEGRWHAKIEPESNVLPLLGAHFQERYASMRWVIVDVRRKVALHHDEGLLLLVRALDFLPEVVAEEAHWQRLWQAYYAAVNIPERENLRLRQRNVPRRYWRYMTEMGEVIRPAPASRRGRP